MINSIKAWIVFLLFFTTLSLYASSEGYTYKIHIDGLKDTTVLLAYHYGDKQFISDTIQLDKNGKGIAKSEEDLLPGMYIIIAPNKDYFEFFVDGEESAFSMETDTSDFFNHLKIKGSAENELYLNDLHFIQKERGKADSLNAKLAALENDSTAQKLIREQLKSIDEKVLSERKKLIDAHPNSLYIKMLQAGDDVSLPEDLKDFNKDEQTRQAAYNFYQNHFFDNVDFTCTGLARTPVMAKRYDTFLEKYTTLQPDSVNNACDRIIALSHDNYELFRMTLVYLLNKYATSKIMGFDAVYVHLVDNYYAKDTAIDWVDAANLYKIKSRADAIRPTLLGNKAPDMNLKDEHDNLVDLYGLKNRYVVLFFWDPDCGHCKKELPHLTKLYEDLKDKVDLEIYAASVETDIEKWKNAVEQYHFPWINVADPTFKSHFREDYDINGTPRLFLLDKDKKIIAKKIMSEQMEGIIMKDFEKNYPEAAAKLNAANSDSTKP
ncbi:MAG: redoxin domain-containing protein [Chitinophagales bacterium]|nr:redoxin domain-containing protein [Bacteroidota bacterium]